MADSGYPTDNGQRPELHLFTRRALTAIGIAALTVIGLLLLWYVAHVLLLAFGGILLGILLWTLADLLQRLTAMKHGWALGIVVVTLVLLLGGLLYLAGSTLLSQVDKFAEEVPESVESVRSWLSGQGWARELFGFEGGQGEGSDGGENSDSKSEISDIVQASSEPVAARLGGALITITSAVVSLIVISVVSIYVAATPKVYVEGIVYLVPPSKRHRAREVLAAIGYTLRWWLIGQGITMTVIGTLTGVGLWAIGLELWLLLGILAAVFNFIPNFGPLISFVPAMLLAWTNGTNMFLAVGAYYMVTQAFEGYVLSPLVQRRAVLLPPAMLIVAQLLMGVLAGAPGVMLAAPFTAVVLVAVKMLYVEDVLGDEVATPDDHMSSIDSINE